MGRPGKTRQTHTCKLNMTSKSVSRVNCRSKLYCYVSYIFAHMCVNLKTNERPICAGTFESPINQVAEITLLFYRSPFQRDPGNRPDTNS